MTGDRAPSEDAQRTATDDLELIRRRIRVRACRRGMRELDIVFGRFAEAHAHALDADELRQFEALLDADDDKAFGWLCAGVAPAPHDGSLFSRILAFCAQKGPVC
jgi:antitoxin CptB